LMLCQRILTHSEHLCSTGWTISCRLLRRTGILLSQQSVDAPSFACVRSSRPRYRHLLAHQPPRRYTAERNWDEVTRIGTTRELAVPSVVVTGWRILARVGRVLGVASSRINLPSERYAIGPRPHEMVDNEFCN
jgi:hypothetical protein